MWQQWEMDRIQQHPLHRLVYVVENKNHLVIRNIWSFRLETLSWVMDICANFLYFVILKER